MSFKLTPPRWSSERVFPERQNPPNYGYLFDVSADRKRIVRSAHLPPIGEEFDNNAGRFEGDARQAVEEFLRQEHEGSLRGKPPDHGQPAAVLALVKDKPSAALKKRRP